MLTTDEVKLGLPKGRMNDGIMTLLKDAGIKLRISERGYRPSMNLEGFRDFCREFAFNSILNDFDAFVEPFIDHCVTTNTKRETA